MRRVLSRPRDRGRDHPRRRRLRRRNGGHVSSCEGRAFASWPELQGVAIAAPRERRGRPLWRGGGHRRPHRFLDADLTIPVEIIDLFNAALDTGADIAIASRYVPGSVVDRPWWRRVMGDVFRTAVHLLVPTGIRDTQCGGKMYTAEAAKDLFRKQRLNGFAFDAEVLFLARRAGYTVREIPFALRQHGETRIDFLADTPKMLRDLFVIRLNDMRGLYGT